MGLQVTAGTQVLGTSLDAGQAIGVALQAMCVDRIPCTASASGSFRAIRILIRLWGRGTRSDLGFLGVSAVTGGSNSV
jgi:hypothetical protein